MPPASTGTSSRTRTAGGAIFNTSDNTTFATGSKDTLPITPGWQCNVDNNVLSKSDVMNSYAVTYKNAAKGEEILYFGLERNANTGDGNVGFLVPAGRGWMRFTRVDSTAFTGDHTRRRHPGRGRSSRTAAPWPPSRHTDGTAVPTGTLNPNAVRLGQRELPYRDGATILSVHVVNTGKTPHGEHPLAGPRTSRTASAPHSLRVAEFFEAGLNLTVEGRLRRASASARSSQTRARRRR